MLVIFIIVGLVAILLISFVNENFTRNRKQLAPGPFRLPILGNLLQLAWINAKEPHLALAKLGENYGDIVSVQMGTVYTVYLHSFEVMEEYLCKSEFCDRYFNGWLLERTSQKRLGIIFSKNPSPWLQLRRFTVRSLKDFGFGKTTKMQLIIKSELFDVVRELKSSVEKNNGIHTFENFFNISVLNVVWSLAAGIRYEHDDPKLLRLVKVVSETFRNCSATNSIIFAFPEWRDWFPDWTGMSTLRNCFKETNAFFQEFIDERKKIGVYKTCPENLVDEFLREIEQRGNDVKNEFTEQQLVAVMSDLFFAGSETTSSTLSWCILCLILNPEVQRKLQIEIDSLVPKDTLPDADVEQKLHYLRATLAETHRIGTVLPLMGPRATSKDTFCGKYFIPKGTNIMANLHGIHNDKSYWKDPENFRPERFLDEGGKFRSDPRLRPFGFGRRICVGEPVASLTLTYYITVLMQNFTFHPVPNETLPVLKTIFGLTNAPQTYRAFVECRF